MKSPIPLTARPPPSLSPNRQGKKKLSAEEKAAKAAEKAAKEEEKRRKAEEKARRQEEARLKREAEDKDFEAEEHERVAQEDAELEPNRTESAGFHTRRDAILADDVRTRRHEHEWDRAARCVTRPDPRSIQAFEAHVEATLATPPLPFHEAFQLMEECELLAKDCEVYHAWAAAEFVADKAAARCLDHANEHQDPETGYIATSANDGTHQWCAVWANHVKNPRKKTIDFPNEVGAFAAELPKQVLSQAVAMRARLTHVDTYSELCTNELMAVKGAGILRVDLLSLPPLFPPLLPLPGK